MRVSEGQALGALTLLMVSITVYGISLLQRPATGSGITDPVGNPGTGFDGR